MAQSIRSSRGCLGVENLISLTSSIELEKEKCFRVGRGYVMKENESFASAHYP